MNSDLFIYRYKKTSTSNILLLILFTSGLYFGITVPSFFAILLSVFAVVFRFTHIGIILDFQEKVYKKGRLFNTKAFGAWKPFPEFVYISVFETYLTTTSTSLSGKVAKLKEPIIVVNLVYEKTKRLNVYQTEDKLHAFDIAETISHKLNLPIFDATGKSGKWLKKDKNTICVST